MISANFQWRPIKTSAKLKSGFVYEGPIGAAAAIEGLRDSVIPEGMADGAAQLAEDMEAFAKTYATWKDRTGAARRGLSGQAFADAGQVGASIVHTVDYGIWLENRFEGRYAIILLTQETFAALAPRIIAGGVRAALEGRGSRVRDVKTGRFA